jgi:PIN domain nuclease of toxin-antitoxin system
LRLLLDTVTFILAIHAPEKLPRKVRRLIENAASNVLEVSTVSITEIAIKRNKAKLDITPELTEAALGDLGARILPFLATHGYQLFRLPLHHHDPFDRFLIAQALVEEIPIVTPDQAYLLYRGLKVIWK